MRAGFPLGNIGLDRLSVGDRAVVIGLRAWPGPSRDQLRGLTLNDKPNFAVPPTDSAQLDGFVGDPNFMLSLARGAF